MQINEFYTSFLRMVMEQKWENNNRTGINVKAVPGVTFRTDLEIEGFPLLSLRKIPFSFIPEVMWFLSGSNNTKWLSKHTKIWDSFALEDGTITSAYGFRWRHGFGFDQIETVLEKLKSDNSTRHGVVMMWNPNDDLLVSQKNVPCPYTFTLNIIGNRLNLHLIIRSNDMVLGFPTDVAGFALLTYIFAQELKVGIGVLTVSISNAHIYENQLEAVNTMLNRQKHDIIKFNVPKDLYKRANQLDDTLIKEIKENIINYIPEPAINNIPIAL